jgi:hypothetical protein
MKSAVITTKNIMKKIFILLTLIALNYSGSIYAGESWTQREKTLEGVYLSLAMIDWGQTRYIAKHPEYWERNRLLGEHPSVAEVNRYFIFEIGTHLAVIHALDHRWREPVQWASILLKGYVVHRNNQIGIKVEF